MAPTGRLTSMLSAWSTIQFVLPTCHTADNWPVYPPTHNSFYGFLITIKKSGTIKPVHQSIPKTLACHVGENRILDIIG